MTGGRAVCPQRTEGWHPPRAGLSLGCWLPTLESLVGSPTAFCHSGCKISVLSESQWSWLPVASWESFGGINAPQPGPWLISSSPTRNALRRVHTISSGSRVHLPLCPLTPDGPFQPDVVPSPSSVPYLWELESLQDINLPGKAGGVGILILSPRLSPPLTPDSSLRIYPGQLCAGPCTRHWNTKTG